MNVLVCVKRVPETGGRIDPHGRRAVDRHALPRVHGQPARGVRRRGGGPDRRGARRQLDRPDPRAGAAADQLRDAMAIGVDRAILLETDGRDWDPLATAAAIVDAIEADRAAGTDYDLLLFGNEAADSGDFQVGDPGRRGPRAAVRRRGQGARARATVWPSAGARPPAAGRSSSCRCRPSSRSARGSTCRATRRSRAGSGPRRRRSSGSCRPPVPGGPTKVRLRLPAEQEKQVEILGTGADAAPAVVELLVRMGLVAR